MDVETKKHRAIENGLIWPPLTCISTRGSLTCDPYNKLSRVCTSSFKMQVELRSSCKKTTSQERGDVFFSPNYQEVAAIYRRWLQILWSNGNIWQDFGTPHSWAPHHGLHLPPPPSRIQQKREKEPCPSPPSVRCLWVPSKLEEGWRPLKEYPSLSAIKLDKAYQMSMWGYFLWLCAEVWTGALSFWVNR